MSWYLAALKKYAVFEGRARRKEYWMFLLFYVLIMVLLGVVGAVIGDEHNYLSMVYGLAMFLPSVAVSVRRLHDTDRGGWWMLISLAPLIGGIVLLVFTVQDGTPGENRFGANPKEAAA